MLVAAYSKEKALVYPALGLGGAAWMAVMATFNTATQTSVPHVGARSRAGHAHPVRAGRVCRRLGVLGRRVGHHRPDRSR